MSETVACLVTVGDLLPEMVRGTPLYGNVVRLGESSVMDERYTFGTEVVVSPPNEDGAVHVHSVYAESPFTTFRPMVSGAVLVSPQLKEFLAEVEDQGGHWELIIHSILLIHIPEFLSIDVTERIAMIDVSEHD